MAIDYAAKFSPKLDAAFPRISYTDAYTNKDFDFDGVSKITVLNLETVPLVDYNFQGTGGAAGTVSGLVDRYGGGQEIQNTSQEFILAKDRSFKGIIDKRSAQDTLNLKNAGKWLAKQTNERVVPEVDTDVFLTVYNAAIGVGGGGTAAYNPATLLHDMRAMRAKARSVNAPNSGMVFFVTTDVEVDLKDQLTPYLAYTSAGIIKENTLGSVDGVPVISVPAELFPADVKVMFWHKDAILSCKKLTETRIITNSEFVSGEVILGRFRFDSFAIKGHETLSGKDTKLFTCQVLEV